jgi:hypothetical protein
MYDAMHCRWPDLTVLTRTHVRFRAAEASNSLKNWVCDFQVHFLCYFHKAYASLCCTTLSVVCAPLFAELERRLRVQEDTAPYTHAVGDVYKLMDQKAARHSTVKEMMKD